MSSRPTAQWMRWLTIESTAFARIRSRVIRNHDLRIQTKSEVYRAICLSTLLYCCETWTLHRRHVKRLEHFDIKCVRKILGVTWQNRVPYVELLSRAGLSSIECMLLRAQLSWAGHVFRMPDFRYPRQMMYGLLQRGSRHRGAPKKRWKDNLKKSLKSFSIDPQNFEVLAGERDSWRSICHRGADHFEAARNQDQVQRRIRPHEAA